MYNKKNYLPPYDPHNYVQKLHCREKQVPFSMAIGNWELVQECFPKYLGMGTARMK